MKNQKEIYDALLKGKKLRHVTGGEAEYIYLDGNIYIYSPTFSEPEKWEIYEKPKSKNNKTKKASKMKYLISMIILSIALFLAMLGAGFALKSGLAAREWGDVICENGDCTIKNNKNELTYKLIQI